MNLYYNYILIKNELKSAFLHQYYCCFLYSVLRCTLLHRFFSQRVYETIFTKCLAELLFIAIKMQTLYWSHLGLGNIAVI